MKDSKSLLRKEKIQKSFNLISLPTISLDPKEAEKFITCVWDLSVMKNYARLVQMVLPEQRIRHIGFGSGKFLYPATKFDESKYKKQFAHNVILLKTATLRGCVPVYDDDLEEGIEGPRFRTTLMEEIIAPQIANELEFAAYMSDIHSYNPWCDDDIEKQFDGWRYIINNSQNGEQYYNSVCGAANIKSACDASSDAEWENPGKIAEWTSQQPFYLEVKYGQMIKNMPAKYIHKFGMNGLVFMNNPLVTQDYLLALETLRVDLAGTIIQEGDQRFYQYHNIKIVDVPLMPTNLGADGVNTPDDYGIYGGGNYTDAMLTYKNNLIIGIQKELTIEPQRSAADRCTYYYYTIKVGYGIENVNAIVFVKCLTHKC